MTEHGTSERNGGNLLRSTQTNEVRKKEINKISRPTGEGDKQNIRKNIKKHDNVCINAQKALPLRKIINITTYETTTIAQIRTHDADLR